METLGSLDTNLLEDAKESTPEKLLELARSGKSYIKIVEKYSTLYPHLNVIDLSLHGSGSEEDRQYSLNPFLQKNIRRGNTLLEIYDPYDFTLYKNTIVARKGLMKFYDLKQEYLCTDEDFANFLDSGAKSKGKKIDKKVENNLRNFIFSPVVHSLKEGHYVEVLKTLKVNGENAQISWNAQEGLWCIASKNVGILAKNRQDLQNYPVDGNSRYGYAVDIALTWFYMIDEMISKGKSMSKLKEALSGKTLVGEYVGNPYLQHLIRYPKQTIVFYSVTDNNRSDIN